MARPWSLLLVFFTGPVFAQPLPNSWGPAQWVWDQPEANKIQQSNDPRFLRRTFQVEGKVSQAELWITVDNSFTVYLNGQKVGQGSEWQAVSKYPVAQYLRPGTNVLAIKAANQGGVAGAIARLAYSTPEGKTTFVATDDQTRTTKKESPDWMKVDFADDAWAKVHVLGDTSLGPWNLTGSSTAGGPKAGGPKSKPKSQAPSLGIVVPGDKVNGAHKRTAQEQIADLHVPEGFQIELVAADPQVINPVTIAVDEKGRIYVSESHTYRFGPNGSPIKPFRNPVVRLDPKPGGQGYDRVLVADGFDDPVMGIAVKGEKLWLTANNYLYAFDLDAKGQAVNKKTLVIDRNKAWNPFGMFVLEWGPDGRLYLSVGNHAIALEGPNNKMTGRGNSGIIVRMEPDGKNMERLVHGLRVPYSFDYDPFGQLWLLSNGEGNPNRFLRVLQGVDYHCYSRPQVNNDWLAGNHPLAPPCEELPRGANTQLLRYFGSAYPAEYWGSLFLDNWGAHGFGGINRAVFRYVPDADNNLVKREAFVSCSDPHFRPSHIALDPEGNLLVADWYGRDDESDLTGRIWRVKYVGKSKPEYARLDPNNPASVIRALGSPQHLDRERAVSQLLAEGEKAVDRLRTAAEQADQPLAAANALWVLWQMPSAKEALAAGTSHPAWKVRRLALELVRRAGLKDRVGVASRLLKDPHPAVRIEAALCQENSPDIARALVQVLQDGAAQDRHLRYLAAWHLAHHANQENLAKLLASEDDSIRLSGLIAVDVALWERTSANEAAGEALAHGIQQGQASQLPLLLTLTNLHNDKALIPALEKIAAREDLPPAVTAQALLVLRNRGNTKIGGLTGKRFLETVEKGGVKLSTPSDHLLVLELLESEGPTPFALKYLAGQINNPQPGVRQAALTIARRFGPKAAGLADSLWPLLNNPKTKTEDSLEILASLALLQQHPNAENWQKLLAHHDPLLRTDAVRWFRAFKGHPEMTKILAQNIPQLLQQDEGLKEDLPVILRHLETSVPGISPGAEKLDRDGLAKYAMEEVGKLGKAHAGHALLGRQVFERVGCVKCHTTVTQNTPLAPSLKGIAAQKLDYLVESVLYPSKIIKTGFETEVVATTGGQVYTGLVKEEGQYLRILHQDKDVKVLRSEVDERKVQKLSIMPEGQEILMSRREFVDLVAFLQTLK